jgi:PhnB protein
MPPKVSPIPDGYRAITAYLYMEDAAAAIEFYKRAFDAKEMFRMPGPDGRIGHAELAIGEAHLMLADESPKIGALSPKTIGGCPSTLLLYVEDVDKVVERAVAAGAKLTRPVENKFYGDRSGMFEDPSGHSWSIATHVEDVPPEELERRAKAMKM